MGNYWRMIAKHTTVCPRCDEIILGGSDTIVQQNGGLWVHAVCPTDYDGVEEVQPSAAKITVLKFDSEGKIV
jgi:hypothetical protein